MRRFLAALILTSSSAFAQTYIESFDVRVNNIDVVVTDRAGNRITGLRQEDFDVQENGVVQPVTNFSEYRAESGTDAAVRSTVTRKFVFLIDSMGMHPMTRRSLKRSLERLITTGMRAGDEAMIVRPTAADRIPLRFTSDRQVLLGQLNSIIDSEHFRADTPLNRQRRSIERANSTFGPVAEAHIFDSASMARTTFGHIQSIVSAMAEVPGKKTMVVVTEWLPAFPGFRGHTTTDFNADRSGWAMRRYDLRPLLESIARTASTNGIAIYSLQPEYGLAIAIPGPDASGGAASTVSMRHNASNTETTMQIFAERTGASWSHEVPKLFETLQNDLTTYYSIGYRPTSSATGKARRIDVTVKGRPELRVRTRRDVIQKSLTEEMNERVVGHLVYPNDVDELRVTTTVGALRRESRSMLVPVTVAIPISSLTLLPDGNTYRGSFTVHYAAAGRGDFSSGVQREQHIEIPAAEIEKARSRVWTYTTDLRVSKGQEIDIAVGVLDPVSRLTSFKTLTIDAR